MENKDITLANGFDIDRVKGSVTITNKVAVEQMNKMLGWGLGEYKIQGLVPNHKITMEEQIISYIWQSINT